MLSTRLHLAFSCRPVQLIAGRLGRQDAPAGAAPCRNRSAFERRLRSQWRRCVRVEDFDDVISTYEDHCAVQEILELYQTEKIAPLWLTKQNVIDMISDKQAAHRRQTLRHLAANENRLMVRNHLSYHHHKHKRNKIPHFGCIFDESGQLLYGMHHNTIFSVTETMKNKDILSNLVHACLFGQPLVIDLSYDHLMLAKQLTSLASQICHLHSYNCKAKHPFDLIFAGYSPGGRFPEHYSRITYTTPEKRMITTKEEPLEQLFPIENIIYLSPHSTNVMTHFDPDAVYVIGGLVDTYRTDRSETSFIRANKSNIRSVRLPVTVKERNDKPPCLSISSVGWMLVDMRNEGISVEEAMNRHLSVRKMRQPFARLKSRQRRKDPEHEDTDSTEQVEKRLLIKGI